MSNMYDGMTATVTCTFDLTSVEATDPNGVKRLIHHDLAQGLALALLDVIQARLINPTATTGRSITDRMDVRVKANF